MTRKPASTHVSQSAIAAEAGVARTTVSLALRGGEGLSGETILRVQQAAERLGYRPNRLVHGLRSGRTGLVGVMVPPFDTFWAEVLFGIHDGLVARDCVPLVLWSDHRAEQTNTDGELAQVHRLVDWRVDGAILWPWFASLYQQHVHEFTDRDLPVVTVDCVMPASFGAHAVLSDEDAGADAVAEHLTRAGHRHLLHLAGPESEAWSRGRRHAFEAAVHRTGEAKVTMLELPLKGPGDELIRQALDRPDRPTAVFAATDHMAEACYTAALSLGLHIPRDLSVVGCGDLDQAARMRPPLTTVRQQPFEMGRLAAELAVNAVRVEQTRPSPVVERLPMSLVDRASVATVPRP